MGALAKRRRGIAAAVEQLGPGGSEMGSDITFVTVFESGFIELEALRLVESLRRWGGRYANAPFFFVKPRAGPGPHRATRRRMHELGVDYRVASRNEYEWNKFFTKPVALREAAAYARTPIVCWLDADVLVLDEPSLMDLAPDIDLAICAKDVNMGTTGPGSRYEAYWDEFCRAVGVSFEELGWVTTLEEGVRIRSYFNAGILSIRASSGLLEEFHRTLVVALDARLASSTDLIIMHDQMAVGIAARRLRLRIHELPLSYNYSCYELEAPSHPASRTSEIVLVHYHGAFFPDKYDGLLRRIEERRPDRLDFVRSLGPINVGRLNPLSRIHMRLLRRVRQRRQLKYEATCRIIETPPLA